MKTKLLILTKYIAESIRRCRQLLRSVIFAIMQYIAESIRRCRQQQFDVHADKASDFV